MLYIFCYPCNHFLLMPLKNVPLKSKEKEEVNVKTLIYLIVLSNFSKSKVNQLIPKANCLISCAFF